MNKAPAGVCKDKSVGGKCKRLRSSIRFSKIVKPSGGLAGPDLLAGMESAVKQPLSSGIDRMQRRYDLNQPGTG